MMIAAVMTVALGAQGALASGTLLDNAVLVMDFADQTGFTPISADNDGTYIWTASGGGTGNPIGRYLLDGTADGTFVPGIDFRSIYVSNGGQLYAKEYCGNVYSVSQSGTATYLFTLADPDCQSSVSFSADDSELYAMVAPTLYRFNAANGAPLGSFTLTGMGGNELAYPQLVQMETNATGRIITYSDGVASEWDLAGNRVGQCTVGIATPADFNTNFSFGVGNDDYVYLYNANTARWEVYDIGLATPTATLDTSWGSLKTLFR
jgi:hypothetical protein